MRRREGAIAWIVLGLIIIRLAMLAAMIAGYPETQYHRGWYFHHGGDQEEYFLIARTLVEEKRISSLRAIGYSLSLIPFLLIYDASTWENILIPVVLFNAFYLFSLSVILMVLMILAVYGRKTTAVLGAGIWVFSPYLLWYGARWISNLRHPGRPWDTPGPKIWMVHQMWANMLSDPLSTFLCILFFYLLLHDAGREKGISLPLLIGLLGVLSVSVRYANAVLFPAAILVYLAGRRSRKALLFTVTVLTCVFPFVIYLKLHSLNPFYEINYQGFISYYYGSVQWRNIPINIQYAMQHLPLPAKILLCTAAGAILWGLIRIFIYSRPGAVALLLWISFFGLFYLSYSAMATDPFRYFMPLYPPVIIAMSVAATDLGARFAGFITKQGKEKA